jgi:hypothetical protein
MRSIPVVWSLLGVAWILALTCGGTGLVRAVDANGAAHEQTVYSEPSCQTSLGRRSRLLGSSIDPEAAHQRSVRRATSTPTSSSDEFARRKGALDTLRAALAKRGLIQPMVPLTRCDIGSSAQYGLEAGGDGAHLEKLEGIG